MWSEEKGRKDGETGVIGGEIGAASKASNKDGSRSRGSGLVTGVQLVEISGSSSPELRCPATSRKVQEGSGGVT